MITLSPQQNDVMDWIENGSGSAFVEAVAGSGKTTTLIEACKRIEGIASLCAFNKNIAKEITDKLRKMELLNVRSGTFHSLGYAAWRIYAGVKNLNVDEGGKRATMMEECHITDVYSPAVGRLVSLAKQSGVGLLWDLEDMDMWKKIMRHHNIDLEFDTDQEIDTLIKSSQRGIEWSRESGMMMIDFDDMIWLPVTTEGVRFYKKDWVLVDEAQDTNPIRRVLASKLLKPGGRMLWVGDRFQAIYGFTGADADAIDQIIEEFECKSLPLTVTYRCPKSIVRTAQQWVSHIQAHESAPEGTVLEVGRSDFEDSYSGGLTYKDAVLCRNTRPLVELAFRLLRMGIGCHVEGRDIGKGLIKMATRWKTVKTTEKLCGYLEGYRERERNKLIARGKDDYAIEALNDRVDTLIVLTDGVETIDELVKKINKMFKDTDTENKKKKMYGEPKTVTLSTVHKAKGREWDRVFILCFDSLMPSPYATKPWQQQQETNLMYVAATRAKIALFFQVDDMRDEPKDLERNHDGYAWSDF